MTHDAFTIQTKDGPAEAHSYCPDGAGPFPPVLVYIDGIGMRPAMHDIAKRIAADGYYVLLPDVLHRVPGWKNMDAKTVFTDPATREKVMKEVIPSATAANAMRDTEAFIAHFDAQPKVKHDGIGVTGYCMGGRLAITAAGTFPDRIAAAGSYHASQLATDAPDSPHRLAPKIKGALYIGGAKEDAGFDDAQKERLRQALEDARVKFTLTTYDARHGWVPEDTPVHDPAEAERAFSTLRDLFKKALH